MSSSFPPGSVWTVCEGPLFALERQDGVRAVLVASDVELHTPTEKRFLFERKGKEGQDVLRNRMTTWADCVVPPDPWVFSPAQEGTQAQFVWGGYHLVEIRPGRWQWRVDDPVGGIRVLRLSGFTSPTRAWAWLEVCGEKAERQFKRTVSVHVRESEFAWLEHERLAHGLARSNFVLLALHALRAQLQRGALTLSTTAATVSVQTQGGTCLATLGKEGT